MDMFFDSLREEPLENWYEINATREEVKVTDSKVGQGTVIVIGTSLNEQRIRELILLSQ